MVTAQHTGVMKITILVDLSMVIITIHLVCIDHAPEYRRRSFKRYINFTLFTIQIPPLGMRAMKFIISCVLTQQMLHTKFGPVVLVKEDVNGRRRTPTNSNRSPE